MHGPNLFAPWIAEAGLPLHNYDRFDPIALMNQMDKEKVTGFAVSAYGLAPADSSRPERAEDGSAKVGFGRRTVER